MLFVGVCELGPREERKDIGFKGLTVQQPVCLCVVEEYEKKKARG